MRVELSEAEYAAVKQMRYEENLIRQGYHLCARKVQVVIDQMTDENTVGITNGEILAALKEIVK